MKVHELAQLCGRLALANEKAAGELETLLDKWVQKNFVKGSSAQALRILQSSGALPSLLSWLRSRKSAADVLAIIRKIDPHNQKILTDDAEQLIAHVDALSRGTAPIPKPKPVAKSSQKSRSSRGKSRR